MLHKLHRHICDRIAIFIEHPTGDRHRTCKRHVDAVQMLPGGYRDGAEGLVRGGAIEFPQVSCALNLQRVPSGCDAVEEISSVRIRDPGVRRP